MTSRLPELAAIPLIEAPEGPLDLAHKHPDRLAEILRISQEMLPRPVLRLTDRRSATWLAKAHNPYLFEIEEVSRLIGKPGAYTLNLSLEWGCTSGCHSPSPDQPMSISRALDLPFKLGKDIVVARHLPKTGPYYNATWPGLVGVVTALAPGRFAASINQAPMSYAFPAMGLTLPVDWAVNRYRMGKQTALPPAHLLRRVFEECATYEDAKSALTQTPLCVGALFTLSGGKPGEGCVIERRERDAVVHQGPACIANAWLSGQFKGRPRLSLNRERQALMNGMLRDIKGNFDWLAPPILNDNTLLAVEMNAGTGEMRLQGMCDKRPVTRVLSLGPGLQ